MKRLDLSLATPAENLALDEALLDTVTDDGERLRFWQSDQPAVILGRASRVEEEVDLEFCRRQHVPILRRCSGGATVVIGPGCLMYAATLSVAKRPELSVIDRAHELVLDHLRRGLVSIGLDVLAAGTCDLVLGGRKFSGNALRCKKDAVLYHGTLLYDADIPFIGRCLKMPPRQPEYRECRPHVEFLANLPAQPQQLQPAIAQAWNVTQLTSHWPSSQVMALVESRYSQDAWHFSR